MLDSCSDTDGDSIPPTINDASVFIQGSVGGTAFGVNVNQTDMCSKE